MADPADLLKELAGKQDKHRHWRGSVLAGYNATTGNTTSNNYLAKLRLAYKRERWENHFTASTERTISDKITTVKRSALSFTTRWLINKKRYTYFNTDYTNDQFAPYVDVANANLGYGWRIIKTHDILLQFQVGPGYQFTRSAKDEKTGKRSVQHRFTANGDMDFKWHINKHVKFEQLLGTVLNKDNAFYRSNTAITAALIGHFALQVAYLITHNTHVPNNSGRANTDTTTNVAIVYAF